MNKKGVTVVELLGAIIVFSLIISLSAVILSLISNANERILMNTRATTKGNYLVTTLENNMQRFSPTNYSACGTGNCVILENHYVYEVDLVTEEINLVIYNPILTRTISISNGQILIDSVALDITYFTLHNTSTLTYSLTAGKLYVSILIVLEDARGKLYEFIASYQYTVSDVPIV